MIHQVLEGDDDAGIAEHRRTLDHWNKRNPDPERFSQMVSGSWSSLTQDDAKDVNSRVPIRVWMFCKTVCVIQSSRVNRRLVTTDKEQMEDICGSNSEITRAGRPMAVEGGGRSKTRGTGFQVGKACMRGHVEKDTVAPQQFVDEMIEERKHLDALTPPAEGRRCGRPVGTVKYIQTVLHQTFLPLNNSSPCDPHDPVRIHTMIAGS